MKKASNTRPRAALDRYSPFPFRRGRGRAFEAAWVLASAIFVSSVFPGSMHRVLLLRLFGATIGSRVVIKSRVRVKFPWRLCIGDYSWIGEAVWIDNLEYIHIGSNVCVSQGAYLCTGSHDWANSDFSLVTRPIFVEDYSWICAKTIVGPGVKIGMGAVLTIGSCATRNLAPWHVYSGSPAVPVKERVGKGNM